MYNATMNGDLPTIMRRNKDETQEAVRCPPLLHDYQQYMKGVDCGDQMIRYYNVGRRSRKWWKRCFADLLECSQLNAYILYSTNFLAAATRGVARNLTFLPIESCYSQLIGTTQARQKAAGCPRSEDHQGLDRLWGTGLYIQKTKWNALFVLQYRAEET